MTPRTLLAGRVGCRRQRDKQYQFGIFLTSHDIKQHVYQFDRPSFNAGMENQELRKKKVQALIAECGSVKAFSEIVGIQPGQGSHLNTGVRNVGTAMARRIEQAFGKERGWIDQPLPLENGEIPKFHIIAKDMDDLVKQLGECIEGTALLEFISKLTAELHRKSS